MAPSLDDEKARKFWEADLHQRREQSTKEARILATERKTNVREQLRSPAFARMNFGIYRDREAIERFGQGLKPGQAISHILTPASS